MYAWLHRSLLLALLLISLTCAFAQGAPSLTGTVTDGKGALVAHANVVLHTADGSIVKRTSSDAAGHFTFSGIPAGAYILDTDAPGFSRTRQSSVMVANDQPATLTVMLQIADINQEVSVMADATGSVAAELAPMDAPLSEMSPHTEISQSFIQNFTSPISDYGEIVQMAPGTYTTSSNGVGLGQSKTYFRGFPDGDYDIDFDGINFYDTNTPTHHSWAFFPAQFVGGVDFDRSPGTASTVGPAPFGGTIHLLSEPLSPIPNVRATFAGGSFNTYLYDLSADSGTLFHGKLNMTADVHHLQSRGYQTLNINKRNAGDIKVEYKPTDKLTFTGYSAVVWLDANTPNFNATRCQMYGVPTDGSYSCIIAGSTLYPYTGAGIKFLNAPNIDPLLYLDEQYNYYHVPTDFEYIGAHYDLPHGFTFNAKGYTYNYDNSEKYSNAVPITDNGALVGTTYAPLGAKITSLCNQLVTASSKKTGITTVSEPCGVDKYNSYRKFGETSELDQVSKLGILRTGLWYERAYTNRHQYPSDPLNNWADELLPNFAEKFTTDSIQPFIEYQFHATPRLNITPGVKFAYYSIGTQQFADNGSTIGCLVPTTAAGCDPRVNTAINAQAFISNGGSYFSTLPSVAINYRLRDNWSAYVQAAQGSVVPPSSVFDFQQGSTGAAIPPAVLPKQQKNTTYQGGTVVKWKYVTFDADYFHIHFDNSYSSFTNPTTGEPTFFVQPSSITQGFEAESNLDFTHGIGMYLNASYTSALYHGELGAACITGTTGCTSTTAQVIQTAPGGLHVAQTPSDIETQGVTYQHGAWDGAIFNHRIGTQYLDTGAYHNQFQIQPFDTVNAFINYTIRSGGRFDQTKLRLSFNNLTGSQNITGISLKNSATPLTFTSNGVNYNDAFSTNGPTAINGQDAVSILPGRSILLSVTFALNPHGR